MKKTLKKIYYWFLYPGPYNKMYPKLDVLLYYLENIGIKDINIIVIRRFSYMHVTFNDNTKAKFWYSKSCSLFMSEGEINFSNGEKLKWDKKNPSRETSYKYRKIGNKKLKEIKNKEDINDDVDFSKYLPLKHKRKMKLKKLK